MANQIRLATNTYEATSKKENNRTNAAGDKSAEGPVTVESVHISDDTGKRVDEFVSGSELNIEANYRINRPVKDLNIGFGLYSVKWGYVFGYTTQMDGVKLDANTKSATLHLPSLPLLPGEYHINIICFGIDEAMPYDFRSEYLRFNTTAPDLPTGYRGILHADHAWITESDNKKSGSK